MTRQDRSDQQRTLLALSFEPAAGGYVYYHWRWSRGIPVTAEEREAYLSIPALGSRRAWRKGIAGRPSVAPRVYRPVHRKLIAALPNSLVAGVLLAGLALAGSGLATLPTLGGIAYLVIGLLMLAFGVQIASAKHAARDGKSPR